MDHACFERRWRKGQYGLQGEPGACTLSRYEDFGKINFEGGLLGGEIARERRREPFGEVCDVF